MNGVVAQLVRAFASHARGRGFEPRQPHQWKTCLLYTSENWKSAIHVDGVLALVWLTGVLYNVFWQARDYRRYIRRLKEASADVQSEALHGIFEEQKRSLGIRRAIPLCVSGAADCPMLAGFAEPVLWLPQEDLSEELSLIHIFPGAATARWFIRRPAARASCSRTWSARPQGGRARCFMTTIL